MVASLDDAIERARQRAETGRDERERRRVELRATMPAAAALIDEFRAAGLELARIDLTEGGRRITWGQALPPRRNNRPVPPIPGVPNDGPHIVPASGDHRSNRGRK